MKNTKIILTLIIVAFFVIAVISLVDAGPYRTHGSLETFDDDDVKYLRSAQTLIQTGQLTYKNPEKPTVFIMPGMTFLLVPFVAAFGMEGAILPFKIFQMLLGAVSILLIFKIAQKIFNEKIALISAFLTIFYIADYFAINMVLMEATFRTLLLALAYLTILALEQKSMKYYCLSGLVWGIMVLFRPTIGLYPLVILILWIVRRYTIQEMFKFGLAVTLIFLTLITPWWVRNYMTFNQFIPLTLSSGNPTLQGTYIHYDRTNPEYLAIMSEYPEPQYSPTDDEIVNNQIETDYAKLRLSVLAPKFPGRFLYWYTIGKTVAQWGSAYVWISMFGLTFATIFGLHLVVLGLAVFGAVVYLADKRRRNLFGLFALLLIVYFNCIHLPYYAFSRYVYPVTPFMMMFAAYFLSWLSDKIPFLSQKN